MLKSQFAPIIPVDQMIRLEENKRNGSHKISNQKEKTAKAISHLLDICRCNRRRSHSWTLGRRMAGSCSRNCRASGRTSRSIGHYYGMATTCIPWCPPRSAGPCSPGDSGTRSTVSGRCRFRCAGTGSPRTRWCSRYNRHLCSANKQKSVKVGSSAFSMHHRRPPCSQDV